MQDIISFKRRMPIGSSGIPWGIKKRQICIGVDTKILPNEYYKHFTVCNVGLAYIKDEQSTNIKFMSKTISIKPAQFIVNLLGLTPDSIPTLVTNIEKELHQCINIFTIALSFIQTLFHTKIYEHLPPTSQLSLKVNKIIMEGIQTLNNYCLSQNFPPHPDPECALVHDLPLNLPPDI